MMCSELQSMPANAGTELHPVGLTENPYQSLFRCNQFVLGPEFAPGLEGWRRIVVNSRLKLTAHPGLNVVQVQSGARQLLLLGVLLDPYSPEADDREILSNLMMQFESLDAVVAATGRLGGRWIIVAMEGDEAHLFSDPFGSRQAFYTVPGNSEEVYVMSDAALGAKMLDIPVESGAQTYMDSEIFRTEPEYKWPATASAFRGIQRLLPNHLLDLNRGVPRRFWPVAPLGKLGVDECVAVACRLLRGLMQAAANRFDLVINVTCGMDSRVVLAASREIVDRASFVTLRQWHMSDESPDIAVPATLLAKLGLEHEVIAAPVTMNPEFGRIFKSSAYLAHDHYGPDAEAIYTRFHREKVAITGSGAEVVRCVGRSELPFFDRKRTSAAYLARQEIGGRDAFAEHYFQQWLCDVGDGRGLNLLDLFEWEQGCGNWLAATQLEFDIAWKDVLTPFNCRDLLIAMLSVAPRHRKGFSPFLLKRIVRGLWPEVMDAPVNPHKRPSSLLGRVSHPVGQLLRHAVHAVRSDRDETADVATAASGATTKSAADDDFGLDDNISRKMNSGSSTHGSELGDPPTVDWNGK